MRSIDPTNLLWTPDLRKTQDSQLWIAGSSFDDGYLAGVENRYGTLLGLQLNYKVTFLSYSGSSITWAADQILRADIREQDIVVWGLTGINRYTALKNDAQLLVWPNIHKSRGAEDTAGEMIKDTRCGYWEFFKRNLNVLAGLSNNDLRKLEEGTIADDRVLDAIKSIFQVVNFCNKIGAQLIIFYHSRSLLVHEQKLLAYVSSLENFKTLSPIVDYAEDHYHPGPETHKLWCSELLAYIV